MTGAEMSVALSDQRLTYQDAIWQHFYAFGRTVFNAGEDSWGYWAVRGDQYCSQWPPADGWTGCDLQRAGTQLRFVGESGDTTAARYAP